MGCLIGFGRWNRYFYYILISNFARFLKDDILGLGVDHQIILKLRISFHPILILLLGYISDLVLSLIVGLFLNYREKKREEKKILIENEETLSKMNTPDNFFELKENENRNESIIKDDLSRNFSIKSEVTLKHYLIHNDVNTEFEVISKSSQIFILLSCCLIVIKEFLTKLIFASNNIFDYYFLNLIITAIILRCFYKKKIYKHHILSIILVCVVSGSCLIGCIGVSSNTNYEIKNRHFYFTYEGRHHLILFMILIYICISICFCTGIIFQKNLMQSKFVASHKFLFYKGIFGILFCIIGLIITTNVECQMDNINPFDHYNSTDVSPPAPGQSPFDPDFPGNDSFRDKTEQPFHFFVCTDKFENKTYLDNFYSYFNNENDDEEMRKIKEKEIVDGFVPEDNNIINTIGEIFILIGYFFLNFISNLSIILVNKFLTPFHYLITESFYSLMHIPYQYFTRISFDTLMEEKRNGTVVYDFEYIYKSYFLNDTTVILKFVASLFEFLGYMIYMEIIQLNFCGLSRDLSKNIKKRAKLDAIMSERELNEEENENNDFFDSLEMERKKK